MTKTFLYLIARIKQLEEEARKREEKLRNELEELRKQTYKEDKVQTGEQFVLKWFLL